MIISGGIYFEKEEMKQHGCPAILLRGVAMMELTKLQKVKFIKGHKLFNL